MINDILMLTSAGLYCPEGDFHIDPWRPVEKAVITHAHADHARSGSRRYLCADEGKALLRKRLGSEAAVESAAYGKMLKINGVGVSFHPAGHILGSAQIRIERSGYVCVVSGDTKIAPDPTCPSIEPLRCHSFITESTFGLPIFRWPSSEPVFQEINDWWRENRRQHRTSILFAYALGKAQRILCGIDPSIGPILTHGAVEKINRCYRELGVALPETRHVDRCGDKERLRQALVIAPPSADDPAWMRRFPERSRAFASGWMRIRGNRRRRAVDRGFILSDHSDWPGLVQTIDATGAPHIGVMHGYSEEMVRWLREKGLDADVITTDGRSEEEFT